MTADWKRHHANAAEKAAYHPLVLGVLEEFADNMGFPFEGLPRYELLKIAAYAAQVARAQALGLDPELLLAAEATLRGVPVYLIDEEGA